MWHWLKRKYSSTIDLSKFKSYKKNILNDLILFKVKPNITLGNANECP